MDNDSSPIRTSKRHKSDESENNDNHPEEPSTSSKSQNNNANSSVAAATEEVSGSIKVVGDSGTNDEETETAPQILDTDANATSPKSPILSADLPTSPPPPPPPPPTDEGDGGAVDNNDADVDSPEFRISVRRTSGRTGGRTRNYRSRMITSSSSSSSSTDSLAEVRLRRPRSRETTDRDAASSDSNVHTSAPEFELDSPITSDSSANYYDEYASSNEDEVAAADDTGLIEYNDVMNKQKPNYNWISSYELVRREHGLSSDGRRSLRNGISSSFQMGFYGSRHVVEKMTLLHSMHKHSGCVNCLNFNRSGDLLCTGSDDTKVVVWDWAANKPKFFYKSGHTENIFQTKFIEMGGLMEIVSTSRDGQVRVATVTSSGGKIRTRSLYKHTGAVHKLALCPQNPFVILSAGEDGKVVCYDLRKSEANTLKTVKEEKRKVPLYSIAHHPFDPEICVCGNDNFVRVFDKRNMSKTVHKMCPQRLIDHAITPHVTCCVYNSTGSEILASYSDDDIYLFNNVVYISGQANHRYRGHYNHKTIKGVNFFGPNSEYVISGSDCGNIFFWDKNTEAILNFMEGDNSGVVNCLEPHPTIPILATSGLDHNIKIWAPNSKTYPPTMPKLDKCVKKNLKRSVVEMDGFDDRQFYYFVRQFLHNSRPNDTNDSSVNEPDFQAPSSLSSGSDEEFPFSRNQIHRVLRPPACNPQ